MKALVQRWGNSLAIRIPKAVAEMAGVAEGTAVDMDLDGGEIRIRAVLHHDIALADLLSGITPENLHGEVETGATGDEAW